MEKSQISLSPQTVSLRKRESSLTRDAEDFRLCRRVVTEPKNRSVRRCVSNRISRSVTSAKKNIC